MVRERAPAAEECDRDVLGVISCVEALLLCLVDFYINHYSPRNGRP